MNTKIQTYYDYTPYLLNIAVAADRKIFEQLVTHNVQIYDTIERQLTELVKINNPGQRLTPEQVQQAINNQLNNVPINEYGTWVHYPWLNSLVHILGEDDFIKVRTSRNHYKITPEEGMQLRTKKIGVIGLSVGQSIALTIATERVCGALHLADFDELELSNMNRITCGVQDMGLPKVIIAARKIAELDPYIKVKCWQEGITMQNMDAFLSEDGNIDVLVEECDGIDVKILSRIKAREKGIPVVMDTNDRGMLDIERFDLEKDRPLFHGKIKDLETLTIDELSTRLQQLTIQEKIGYLGQIIGMENVSDEMKISLSEMNKTITGWPQLASAVTLGGAMVTDVCRRIVLGKLKKSGRYFLDFNELIN